MVVAEIDKDYFGADYDGSFSKKGHKFETSNTWSIPLLTPRVRWRTKDDDGELCYGGWLLNDSEGDVQLEVLRYCMADVGATIIEIREIDPGSDPEAKPKWVQEIG